MTASEKEFSRGLGAGLLIRDDDYMKLIAGGLVRADCFEPAEIEDEGLMQHDMSEEEEDHGT